MTRYFLLFIAFFSLFSCFTDSSKTSNKEELAKKNTKQETPFIWDAANVYFLLTDRFYNGNTENDLNYGRTKEAAMLRGFEGGDIAGVIKKIEEGYFDDLGINAIWFSPIVEQIHDSTDEGTGNTYAFHGYWAKDWTSLDANFSTEAELKKLVETAHQHGIRILLDVVINHTGPVTPMDTVWPENWVRTSPGCSYQNYETAVTCTLVENLPDIRTESSASVNLPPQLVEKWKTEGRYDSEVAELNAFFETTKLPKTPANYIIKWLTDYVRTYGIDGFRVDTVKHVEEGIWKALEAQAAVAFNDWKKANPNDVLDDNPFYMIGELYGYSIDHKRFYDFGDKKVDYFANGFHSLINFQFKYDAKGDYETLFSKYDALLNNELKNKSVLNYVSSHDDGSPFDKERAKPYESATKLLLTPGASQVYYGDETKRSLIIKGTSGDATLRSFMNWEALASMPELQNILTHWQKLGTFRKAHPAVGVGRHKMISKSPYLFTRSYNTEDYQDKVTVGLDLTKGKKELDVANVYANGTVVKDHYSGKEVTVTNGKIILDTPFDIVLLHE